MRSSLLLAAAVSFALYGCTPDRNPPRTTEAAPLAPATQAAQLPPAEKTAPAIPDLSIRPIDAPDHLAKHVNEYTRQMEQALQKRNTAAVQKPAPAESDVKWPELPKQEKPAAPKPQPQPEPVVKAPEKVAPKNDPKQQVLASPLKHGDQIELLRASVNDNPLNDMPAIVPEGEEGVANTPSATVATPDPLNQRITKRVTENPADLSAQLDYQLLKFLNDEPVPAASQMTPISSEDRELLSSVLDGLSNFRSGIRAESTQTLSKKARPILEMADRVRTQTELAIPVAQLCKRVDGFGVYEPISNRFPAGKEHPVIVYCEVDNFTSQLNDQKKWETKLQQEATLFTDTGMMVWQDKARLITDQSRNRRRDFFVIKIMKLPANLTVNRYLLKVSITDQQSKRVAEATLPIQITAE